MAINGVAFMTKRVPHSPLPRHSSRWCFQHLYILQALSWIRFHHVFSCTALPPPRSAVATNLSTISCFFPSEFSSSHRYIFTALLLRRRDAQTWVVGEKKGFDADRALIASKADEWDALRLPIFLQSFFSMFVLWQTTAKTLSSKFALR